MKEKIIVKRGSTVLYKGNILNIPLKEKDVVEKSIEIFGDADPCIVHLSFVVKELVTDLLDIFEDNNTTILKANDFLEELNFIDFEDMKTITFELVRKRK